METWEPIQRSIDYIEQHIQNKHEIPELARISYLSVFYFQRLFKRLVGKPVMEYSKLRKLAWAAKRIAETKEKISAIAFSLGFENHETFTRAFKETYGITPNAYRNAKPTPIHFSMPDLSVTCQIKKLNIPLVLNGIAFELTHEVLSQPRYFDLSKAADPKNYIANAQTEAPHILGKNHEPQDFIGWRIPVGSYIVCRVDVETTEQIASVCQTITRYIGVYTVYQIIFQT